MATTVPINRLMEVLALRHEFLEAKSIELNHVLQDGRERADFLTFAKDKYHSDPEQKRLQERDVQEGGNKKMHAGKHARWAWRCNVDVDLKLCGKSCPLQEDS